MLHRVICKKDLAAFSSSSTLSTASSTEQCKNCPKGQTACNGKCVDPNTAFQSDPSNCGSCGNACTAPTGGTATYTNGQCGQTCPSGQEVFNGQCIDKCPEGQTRDQSTGQCLGEECPPGSGRYCPSGEICGYFPPNPEFHTIELFACNPSGTCPSNSHFESCTAEFHTFSGCVRNNCRTVVSGSYCTLNCS